MKINKRIQLILVLLLSISVFLNLVQLFVNSGASKKVNDFLNKRDTLYIKDTIYNTDTLYNTDTFRITQTVSNSFNMGSSKLTIEDVLDSANSWLRSSKMAKAYENAYNEMRVKYDTLYNFYKKEVKKYNDLLDNYSPKKYTQMEYALNYIKNEYGITYKVEKVSDSTERYLFTKVSKVRTFDSIGYQKILDSIHSSKRHKRRK